MTRHGIFLLTVLLGFTGGVLRAQDKAGLDDWLDRNVKEMGGRAILVVSRDGKMVYSQSVNEMTRRQKMTNKFVARRMGNEANTNDYTMDTRLPVASCSKWFSAALVMTFVDERRLSLDDTVGKYLPVLTEHGKGNITMRECLSHLTGIKEPPLKQSLQHIRGLHSMDEAIDWIAGLPMEGEPGKVFHYSNAGLQIAAAVLEKISGKTFEVLFAERITRPLEMTHTDFGMGPVALAAGGAFSTPADYMKFLGMIAGGGEAGGHRILSAGSVSEMQVNRITHDIQIAYSPAGNGQDAGDADGRGDMDDRSGMDNIGYGYGEWVFADGAVSSPGLFGSVPIVDNKHHYCAFLMTFYLKNKGRVARLKELKSLLDRSI